MKAYDEENAIAVLQEARESLAPTIDWRKLLEQIIAFVTYLQESEKLLILAIERAQHQKSSLTAPTSGAAEFGWLPYLLKHADDKDSSDPLIIAFQKHLKEVFGRYTDVLEKFIHVIGKIIDPKITQQQWDYLEANMDKSNIVANNGTIVGTKQYQDLDTGWLYVPANYLYNLAFHSGIAEFTPPAPAKPYNGKIGGSSSSIKVAIIGDWGTGDYEASADYDPAAEVLQAVQNLNPDYVIHLGDVYYCGTDLRLPPGEEATNLLANWPTKFAGKSFTLNSNHPLNPLRSFDPLSSFIIDFASEVVIGSILNATSFITSVMMPPSPTIITGPN